MTNSFTATLSQLTERAKIGSAGKVLVSSLPDIGVLSSLTIAAVVIDWDFLTTGEYLPLFWGDWIHHAYRTRFIQEHGLATWDHNWSGGISLFQTYQFIPHVITAIASSTFEASIGRTMLLLEGVLLIWVRVSGYVVARAMRLPVAAAAFAGVVTFGINNYAAEVLSYASLWGLALVPVLFFFIYRYAERPAIYPIAVATGFGIYVHPHLALIGVVLLFAAFLIRPLTKERAMRFVIQGALVSLASAFFWVPALLSARPPMQDPTSADPVFMRGILAGGVGLFSDIVWVLIPLIAASLAIFWKTVRSESFKYVALFAALILFLIGVSYAGVGPERLRLMQGVRLTSVLPLAIGMLGALAIAAAMGYEAPMRRWRPTVSVIGLGIAAVLFVPLSMFAENHPYRPAYFGPDPVQEWLAENQDEINGRVWLGDLPTALYTYRNFDEFQAVMSHFPAGDWSLLARPIQEGVIVGAPPLDTAETYLKAMAASHLFVEDGGAFSRMVEADNVRSESYRVIQRFPEARALVYQMPWEPVQAFLSDAASLPEIEVAAERYKTLEERGRRDEQVAAYAELAYSPNVTAVDVAYPSPTRMTVDLAGLTVGRYLIVAENWDRAWKAETAEGRGLSLERYGPNYIRVDVSKLEGNVTVELQHEMSNDWKLGIALTLLSVPAAGALMLWERRRQS
ncbi:MAG: hypothetical protein J4N98_05700 [Chloroflexi bacterium]|nr:hypothetical protein [Chloroflexota bacterium]